MNKFSIKDLAELSIVAALYVVLTVVLTPISYGDIQFRLSEVLMLLIVYRKRYAISLILGCFVANLFSPVGWVDIIFGTLATAIAAVPMMYIKKLEISSLFPSITNGIIVGLELSIVYDLPIALTMAQVFIGEFVVVTMIGVAVFKALEKNEGFMNVIGADPLGDNKWINPFISISIAINIINIIFFFKLSLNNDNTYTLFDYTKDSKYLAIPLIIIPIIYVLIISFVKKLPGLIINIILAISYLIIFICIALTNSYNPCISFYLYLLIPIFMVLLALSEYVSNKINEEEVIENN